MHRPHKDHYEAALRIVRYLKGTVGHGVLFKKNENRGIYGYTDADWASNPIDRKSTGGYFTFVEGNLVTWRSKKQKVVALSSAEAEFRGIKSGLMEILWLRRMMKEIGLTQGKSQLFCDNKAAISIFENPVQHDILNMWKLTGTSSKKTMRMELWNYCLCVLKISWHTSSLNHNNV